MIESAVQETVAVIEIPVKAPKLKKATSLKSKAKVKGASKTAMTSHPPTSQMINAAVKNLKERGGSSLQAIKKYIASTYKVDAEKLAPFIKKYLKSAVESGALIRTKGKGASGSFKLPTTVKSEPVKKVPKKPKAAGEKKIAPKPKKVKSTNATTLKKTKMSAKSKPSKLKAVALKKSPNKKKTPIVKKPKALEQKKVALKKRISKKKTIKK